MSGKLHLHSDHSQTALTLEIEVEFEWSLSVGYTSLEPHSHEVVINNMANVWLERLEQLDNLLPNNRNENRNYNFNYEMYDEEQFRSRFRLTKDGFREMLNIIEADISAHNERGNPIPAEIKLLLTLRYYATDTFQEACGDLCYISQPSASRIIKCVSEAIARLKIHYIQFPTADMLPQIKLDFWRICAFPNVVGTIDCTHIKIPCPGGENAELFRNRKGFFSLNVQAVSGPNLEIQNIVVRWPSSVHDSRIFENSRLCAQFERGDIQGMLLGDNGYPCRPYLMTPLVVPQTPPEGGEDVRGLEKVIPCLSMSIRTKLSTNLTIIVATAVLYNFIRGRNYPIEEETLEGRNKNPLPAMNDQALPLGNATHRALIIQHFT